MNTDNNHTETGHLSGIMLILGMLTFLGLLTFLLNGIFFAPPKAKIVSIDGQTQIIIPVDRDNHFRVKGTINNLPVMFLIDTGASQIAVPFAVAKKANLPHMQEVIANTAGGLTSSISSRIFDMTIAQMALKNVNAIIVPNMPGDEVLLGMNVLQHFKIQITDESMILLVDTMNEF